MTNMREKYDARMALKIAREKGIELRVVRGKLMFRAPSGTDDMVDSIKNNRDEIKREMLKEKYHMVFGIVGCPEESNYLCKLVEERGYALTWCDELHDAVAFHRDDIDTSVIPDDFVPYSMSELSIICREELERLRTVHHAKKIGGTGAEITTLVKSLI